MDRFALRAVEDLLPAAGAVGDDDRIGRRPHGRQQLCLRHLHGDLMVRGFVAESFPPCRSTNSR